MAEVAFLEAVRAYLAGPAGLSPAPGRVGFATPVQNDPLPLVTLSLSAVSRLDVGLGGGTTEVSEGALQVVSTIDLADPVLPGPDSFGLLDDARRRLTLPHGGLIRADALDGALGPDDLAVTVGGAARTLVAASPNASQFTVEPLVGVLTFGAALPASGALVATYHLGIWERATTLIKGTLDVGVWDTDPGRMDGFSGAAVRALIAGAGGALPGLQKIRLTSFGEIGAPQPAQPRARRRDARFEFEFEHLVDTPASSGGIISRVSTTARMAAFARDPATGALVEAVHTETDE